MADIDSLKQEYRTNLTQCMQRVKTELDSKASNTDLATLQEKVDAIETNLATLTVTDNVFGTHGAKAMYDELTTAIGEKANATDLTSHTDDTDIHVTTTDKAKWDKVTDKLDTVDLNTHKDDTTIHITSDERTKWNKVDGKADKSYVDDNFATIDNVERFSTTEIPIGTWIDGKTIYRIYTSFPAIELKPYEWNIVNSLSITGINEVINARAKRSEDNAVIPLAARSIGTLIEVNPSANFGISRLILEYTKNN